jgi:hypothetical protein
METIMDEPRHGNPQPWQHEQHHPGYGTPAPQGYSQQQPDYGPPTYNQQYQPPVRRPPKRPNHILHLIITVLTCGAWSNVWVVLTARYWNVIDYRNPREQPGMNRRTNIAVVSMVAVNIVGVVAIAVSSPSDTGTGTSTAISEAEATTAKSSAADPKKAAAAKKPAAEPAAPKLSVEDKFIRLVEQARDNADNADNAFRKRLALTNRNTAICKLLKTKRVQNWTGEVKTLDTNGDGLGVLEIEIADDIKVSTWNNALSDLADDTLIKKSSSVFEAMASLAEGDQVTFSGKLIRDTENCIGEQSITDDGSTQTPTFTMRFSKLAKN